MSSTSGTIARGAQLHAALAFAAILCALPAIAAIDTAVAPPAAGKQAVVLLHGLARGSSSWGPMTRALTQAGYEVCNIAYPSREHSVEELARDYIAPAISTCFPEPDREVDFVTHSMGGLLVRQLAAASPQTHIRRVVMLSPPNHGSEAADKLMDNRLYRGIGGPAALELGTSPESLPQKLGAAQFDVGIITGDRSLNPILSMTIPGADDGKVSTQSARVDGMRDMLVLHTTHVFIMRNTEVIRQTLHFLAYGEFRREDETARAAPSVASLPSTS